MIGLSVRTVSPCLRAKSVFQSLPLNSEQAASEGNRMKLEDVLDKVLTTLKGELAFSDSENAKDELSNENERFPPTKRRKLDESGEDALATAPTSASNRGKYNWVLFGLKERDTHSRWHLQRLLLDVAPRSVSETVRRAL